MSVILKIDNLLSVGTSDQISQYFDLLVKENSPRKDMLNGRIISMLKGVLDVLCSERDEGRMELTFDVIRKNLRLDLMIGFSFDNEIDESKKLVLNSYLVNLPCYSEIDAMTGNLDWRTYEQHGFFAMYASSVIPCLANIDNKTYRLLYKSEENQKRCLYVTIPQKEYIKNKMVLLFLSERLNERYLGESEFNKGLIISLDEIGSEYCGVEVLVIVSPYLTEG